MVYTLLLTFVQIRWEYYLQPIAIILCAALLPGAAMKLMTRIKAYRPKRQWRPYLVMIAVFAMMNAAAYVVPSHAPVDAILCMNQVRYVLQTQQLQPILGDKDTIVFLPENAGGDALFFSPYRIIASNYHREGQGLKDMRAITTAKTEKEARDVLVKRKVQALLYCPASEPADSWIHQFPAAKQPPPWLQPVTGLKFFELEDMQSSKPVLYKVRK
jgi:hypothetical protein